MKRAPLSDVLIDDITWRCATRARRAEWQKTIAELLAEAVFCTESGAPLQGYVTVHREGIAMALHEPDGRQVGMMEMGQQVIAPIFKEYMGIIREMTRSRGGANSPQFEALDIAKRLTHDDAAELIKGSFQGAIPDHRTARRLFTLLVELTHDTTRLGGAASG